MNSRSPSARQSSPPASSRCLSRRCSSDLENIVRHMELGEKPFEAAMKGSKEIGFTILSMTISLAAVFIPILFMGGILGRLFHEFAVTIGAAILTSGFVSLSLTPLLSAKFLKAHRNERH